MGWTRIDVSVVFLLVAVNVASAEATKSGQENGRDNIRHRESLTNGFWGLNDRLEDKGITVEFGLTNVYQQNIHGGLSKHRRAGRFAGSYDLEVAADLQRLLGIDGGSLYILTEGKWSKSGGIDAPSVGSAFGVNGDGAPRRSIDVTELWYEQAFADEKIRLRIGKMDLTGGFEHHGCPVAFDCSSYAKDETTQFLNGALVNNPTIPFPEYGLGVAVHYSPTRLWYMSGAVADAQADIRKTGFNTTFHDEDYFFYIFETGVTPQLNSANGPLPGAYRIGIWNDPQPKANSDTGKSYRDDVGFYTSCDQMLTKENSDPEDTQGLGAFLRYGYAPSKRNDITNFWSAGFQYQGLFDGRDDDVLGLGYAHGVFADSAALTYPEDYESVLEVYYNAQITPWFNISPNIQYIANPGGSGSAGDAVVFGIRAQMKF